MNDENDRINVDGNFIMDSVWSRNDRLTAGILEVKGDFTQKRSASSSSSSYTNFRSTGTHKVVLSGTGDQVVSFASPLTTGSCFSVLELSNTSGNYNL
ncbi:MAG: hypothetical protein KAX49_17985 [Halanaerobiales bacterium]|nr:hypothetical protein [Halanaerobiales bacterium]